MLNKKIICPLSNQECIEDGKIVNDELHACRFWIKIVGQDPQTGQMIDNYDCTFCWQPILMLENSKMQRQTGAAVESFRNEMVKSYDSMQLLNVSNIKMLGN